MLEDQALVPKKVCSEENAKQRTGTVGGLALASAAALEGWRSGGGGEGSGNEFCEQPDIRDLRKVGKNAGSKKHGVIKRLGVKRREWHIESGNEQKIKHIVEHKKETKATARATSRKALPEKEN